jgi:pyridoxamine 5'-phosphate oxidase
MNIADIRKEYQLASLDESEVAREPLEQFGKWFNEALAAKLPEPTAMTLATADSLGRPSARIVLLKGFDAQGFVFYTNYESRKGRELAANTQAALLFHWVELERQVRIEGRIVQVDAAQSDAYFRERPYASQLGAWASRQSEVVPNRIELERRIGDMADRYGKEVPRPPHWGGYRLTPQQLEFWQGRPSRLHDRVRYRFEAGKWVIERLAP